MIRTLLLSSLVMAAGQQQASSPAAPAPGSPGIYKAGDDLAAALARATASAAGMSQSAIANNDQYRVNLIRRANAAGALAHPGNTELHYIVDGAGTMVTGGVLVRPTGGGTATIQGGETRRLVKGDVIIIPPNTPHWYKEVEGSITYLEARFVAPAAK